MLNRHLIPTEERRTFADMLDALYANKHTGPVTMHFVDGRAQTVEIPAPSTKIALDNGTKRAQS